MSFIFKITTTTSPQTFVIPCVNVGTFNATVDYGDGTGSQTVTAYNDSNLTHSFATAGQHTITIDGTFPNIKFQNNAASRVLMDEVVDLGDVGWVTLDQAFRNCTNLTAFNGGTTDTSNVTSMFAMFFECLNLTTLNVSSFNTSSVTNMRYIFTRCSSLTSLDLSKFDTSSATNMLEMFRDCSSLTTLDVSSFNTSSNTNMSYMFYNCSSLTTLDVSNFDTSSVTAIQQMFRACSSLTSLDLSSFDTSSVTTMQSMFQSCSSLTTLDVSSFDTSSVTTMQDMFNGCSSLTSLNVSSFNTSSNTNMAAMFYGCSSLTNLDINHFDVSSVTDGTSLLQYANNALTTTAYDELLEAWAAQEVQPNVPWHFGNAQYTVETVADWYSPRGGSSLSIINNKLVGIADSTAVFGAAQQVDNLIVGKAYRFVGTATCSNSSVIVKLRISGNPLLYNDFDFVGTGTVTVDTIFIATRTTMYFGTIVTGHAANDTVTIDAGITVKEITNYTEANAASEIESSVEGNNAVEYKNIPQSARELYSLEDDTWTDAAGNTIEVAEQAAFSPVTAPMTLTEAWTTRGTAYSTLQNATSASVRVDATISNTDDGILMEMGADAIGLILYVYSGVLYFQCGDGSAYGTASNRAEVSYTLPVGEADYIIEWSADTSNAVLYVNGLLIASQTFSVFQITGGDVGTLGEVNNLVPVNRGGWVTDGSGVYTNTITKCDIFNNQITSDV